MWRRPAYQTLSKVLDISSATARIALDLLKMLAILSDTTVRRSAVDQDDLKPYWKSERPHFSGWSTVLSFTSFIYKDFTNYRKKTNRSVIFSCRPFPTSLNTGTTNETFLQSGKQDSFRYILKTLASKFRLTILKNHLWNRVRTRRLWWIKVCYGLFNHLGSYRNYSVSAQF